MPAFETPLGRLRHLVAAAAFAAMAIAAPSGADPGRCGPVVDLDFDAEHGGWPSLDWTAFEHWRVANGSVDLLGRGFLEAMPGSGLYVDLDGSLGNAGRLESGPIDLPAGGYVLTLRLAGNQRHPHVDTMTVRLGDLVDDVVGLDWDAPWTDVQWVVLVREPVAATLVLDHDGDDGMGMLLDRVTIAPAGEPCADPCTHPFPEACRMDLDGDGVIGGGDVQALLGSWGERPDGPLPLEADLDCSGLVDLEDLLALQAAWGACHGGTTLASRSID